MGRELFVTISSRGIHGNKRVNGITKLGLGLLQGRVE